MFLFLKNYLKIFLSTETCEKSKTTLKGLLLERSTLQIDAITMHRDLTFEKLLEGTIQIGNVHTHFDLKEDLIEHLWNLI